MKFIWKKSIRKSLADIVIILNTHFTLFVVNGLTKSNTAAKTYLRNLSIILSYAF